MYGGLVSNAKFQCLGMSWGCYDNGLEKRQKATTAQGRERNFFFDFMKVYLDLPETVGGL